MENPRFYWENNGKHGENDICIQLTPAKKRTWSAQGRLPASELLKHWRTSWVDWVNGGKLERKPIRVWKTITKIDIWNVTRVRGSWCCRISGRCFCGHPSHCFVTWPASATETLTEVLQGLLDFVDGIGQVSHLTAWITSASFFLLILPSNQEVDLKSQKCPTIQLLYGIDWCWNALKNAIIWGSNLFEMGCRLPWAWSPQCRLSLVNTSARFLQASKPILGFILKLGIDQNYHSYI